MFFAHRRFLIARFVMILALLTGMFGMTPVSPASARTIAVTNINDSGPGSLRQAIADAVSGDTITFDPALAGQTITLSTPLMILHENLVLDGFGLTPPVVLSGGKTSRIMSILIDSQVLVSSIDFTQGVSTEGGAIYANGNSQLIVDNSTFYQNTANAGGAIAAEGNVLLAISNSTFQQNQADFGGAISNLGGGLLNVESSTFLDNHAAKTGGAISGRNITINKSTLSGNVAEEAGGAIYSNVSVVKISNTTMDRNQTYTEGGAIALEGSGSGTIVNSTIFQNQAGESGGGIFLFGNVHVDILNSTVASNTAPLGNEFRFNGVGVVDLHNTLFICTTGTDTCYSQFQSYTITMNHSVLGTGTLSDYGLAELADNGGPTQTMALLPESQLIDAGDDSACANPDVNNLDQRGMPRQLQGTHCDIGAFEATQNLVVTTTVDTDDGVCDADCSLRDAISQAVSGDTIIFDPSLAGNGIGLSSQLLINKDLTIDGSTLNPPLTLSGGLSTRIMQINYPAKVTISGLTLKHGRSNDHGGAVYSTGEFTAIDCLFLENAAGAGGAIWGGDITVINSTFSRNVAYYGGAITSVFLDSRNSTFHENEAFQDGGAINIYGDGSSTIANSTIFQNKAGNSGGGLFMTGFPLVRLLNNTFAENAAVNGDEFALGQTYELTFANTIFVCNAPSDDCYVPGGNTITNTNSILGLGTLHDYGLSVLADNGGPTQTMALLPDSPLIDAGNDTVCGNASVNNLDQRGVSRLQGSHCDIGAYEDQLIVRYVKQGATGSGNGSSWANAHTDLQAALAAASPDEEIWVASGTYKPTSGTDRTVSFVLKNGVALYGGFDGTETALTQRHPEINITTLSGDIGDQNDSSDNSYHVVVGSNTDHSAILDGFTITGGNANDPASHQDYGGGMYIHKGNPGLNELIFIGNQARFGGGIYVSHTEGGDITIDLVLTNIIFRDNSASGEGGGMATLFYPDLTSASFRLSLTDVLFENNTAVRTGGGLINNGPELELANVTFRGNTAAGGGGLSNIPLEPSVLTNVTFDTNSASDGGGGLLIGSSGPVLSTLTNVTFSNNSTDISGGGIVNAGYSELLLTNVTFSENTADVYGGGLFNGEFFAVGGGGTVSLIHTTFSNNTANSSGGAIHNQSGNIHIHNSILYGDTGGEIVDGPGTAVVTYSVVQGGFAGGTNIITTDPVLGTLGQYGGFTETIPLQPGSSAIDTGNDVNCPATDQRGVARPQDAACDIGAYESQYSSVNVRIGNSDMGSYTLNPQQSQRKSYLGVSDGPVKVANTDNDPIMAAERVVYKVNGMGTSYTEMIGLPHSQLDTTYWLPWYNNVELDTQLRFANVSGSTATVRVYIGDQEMTGSPFTLAAGESTRKSFPGISAGPVKIESNVDIVAAERVVYKVNGIGTSYTEMIGLPHSQLDTTYWLPWYNNVELDTQIRFANVTNAPATVHVYIGGQEMPGSPFTLLAGESTRKSFPSVNDGPVKIESNVNIVAAERVVYKVNGANTSFSEMMALPDHQLDTSYWFPWYNNVELDTQLRFGNIGASTTTIHVYVAGQEVQGSPFTLAAGESTRKSFAGVNNGPVEVTSDIPIVVAQRVVYKVSNIPTSFSELMGLPDTLLDATFWFPWYNNATADLDTQLRFGLP